MKVLVLILFMAASLYAHPHHDLESLNNSVLANAPHWSAGCSGLPKSLEDAKVFEGKEFACRKVDLDGDKLEDLIVTVHNEGVMAFRCVGRMANGDYAYSHMPVDPDFKKTMHLWRDEVSVD
ncbi:MAG: hypothetical protein GY752_06100 [bacterium]|nr:hypothetical protein [bacterium]MCP4800892.1 hypothetical protein [bacterium]